MRLSDARVVLTGASGGIGLAIVSALCASGAYVLAVARHRAPLEALLAKYPEQLCWGRRRSHRRRQPADQRRRGQSLHHA